MVAYSEWKKPTPKKKHRPYQGSGQAVGGARNYGARDRVTQLVNNPYVQGAASWAAKKAADATIQWAQRKAHKSFTSATTRKPPIRRSGVTSTNFVGKLPKPRSKERSANRIGYRGCVATLEAVGQVQDDNCVFVHHASHSTYLTLRTATISLLRTLLKRGIGWDSPDANRVIPNTFSGATYAQSTNLRITIECMSPTGAFTFNGFDYVFGIDHTLNTICGGLNLGANTYFGALNTGALFNGQTLIQWFASMYATSGTYLPKSIRLWINDNNGVIEPSWKLLYNIDFDTIMVHTQSTSSLKLQNRSINLVGDDDANDVDNVPLCGKSYDFSSYAMRCRNTSLFDSASNENGMTVLRASDFLLTAAAVPGLKEPPLKGIFANCKAIGKVNIDPGTIKLDKLSFKRNINWQRLFQLAYTSPIYGSNQQTGIMIGTSRMYALEKYINMKQVQPSTLPIIVVYENNIWAGSFITIKKKTSMMSLYDTMTVTTS